LQAFPFSLPASVSEPEKIQQNKILKLQCTESQQDNTAAATEEHLDHIRILQQKSSVQWHNTTSRHKKLKLNILSNGCCQHMALRKL